MALLTEAQRKKYFAELGLGEYNEANILKVQKKYLLRKSDWDGVYGTNTDNLIRHLKAVKDNTKNFAPEEFRCGCGGRHCCGYPTWMKPSELANIQSIRSHYAKPMVITCGVRCVPYNREVGGITNSEHLHGYAADYYIEGVTDTLSNRQNSIGWISSLPNHHYTYGNGLYASTANGKTTRGYVSAPYMGNAMHTDSYDGTPVPAGKLVVDGIGGAATVRRTQEFFGTGVDGVISGQNKSLAGYYPSLVSVSYGSGGSACIKNLQRWIGETQDGIIGQNTVKAWQEKIGVKATGTFNAASMKAWQKYLNGHDKPVYPPDPKPKTKYKVIDISEHQGTIDFKKVKADGVVGVITRYAEDDYYDPRFTEYMKGAKAAGLHVGAYIYSWAKTKAEAENYAVELFNACKPYGCDMPLYIDLEKKGYERYADDTAIAFLNKMKKLGGTGGVYASLSWWHNHLTKTAAKGPIMWVAQYYKECQYRPLSKVGMWQYTSEGSVKGINRVVDMNECYVPYWEQIKPTPDPGKKSYPGNYPRIGRAKMLVDEAVKLAWPSGTPKSTYAWRGGSARASFTAALDKVYPEHNSWGPAPAKGCSCDVFVGTVVRSSGIDSKFPRGLDEQEGYSPQGMFKYVMTDADMYKQSIYGDVIWYDYPGPGGHVLIRGKDCLYQAGYQSTYGHVTDGLDEIKDVEPKVVIFRPRNYLMKGDTGLEVKRLQHYLMWGGWLAKGQDDSIFGAKTETATKKMQKALGVTVDGKVGSDTLTAMRKYKK